LDDVSVRSLVEYGDDGQIKPVDHQIKTSALETIDSNREELFTYDIGGGGDCFFQAMNMALLTENLLGMKYTIATPKAWYQYLSAPIFSYITDEQIPAISNRLRVSITVYMVRGNIMRLQKFGDYPQTIRIVEWNSEHYTSVPTQSKPVLAVALAQKMGLSGMIYDYQERMDVTRAEFNSNIVSHPTLEDITVESQENDEESKGSESDEASEDSSISSASSEPPQPSPFPEENDPRYREEVSLDYFIKFCYSIASITKKSLKLVNVDSKLYYKLRHNLFKTYCLSSLGIVSNRERPFCEVPSLGLTSMRTPDYLEVFGGVCYLVEFTVSNRRDAVLASKEYFTKYYEEVKSSIMQIKDYYMFFTLDSDMEDVFTMIIDMSESTGLPLKPNFKDELVEVEKTIKAVTAYFNDFCPEVLSMNVDQLPVLNMPIPVDVPPLFNEVKNLKGKKAVRQVRVKNLIMRNQRRLLSRIRGKPSYGSYRITVNFVTSSCFIEDTFDGATKDQILNALDLGSIPEDFVKVIGDYYVETSIFEGVNDDIEDPISRAQDFDVVTDTSMYESQVYRSLHKYNMTTLADKKLEDLHLKAQTLYMEQLGGMNAQQTLKYESSPFIFYPCDALVRGPFNLDVDTKSFFMNTLIKVAMGKNTTESKIIDRSLDYDKLDTLNREVAKMGFSLREKYRSEFKTLSRMNKKRFDEEKAKRSDLGVMEEYRSKLHSYAEVVNEKTRLVYKNRIRINCKLDGRWTSETDHFKKPKNVHKVITGLDFNSTLDDYKSFMVELFEPNNNETLDDILSSTKPLGKTLANNCEQMRDVLDGYESDFKRTLLAHSTLLTSQVCYSLMYYSNIKLNRDDFMYDNLGYKNVLLIVKGGKKIRSTRVSRFFKLLFPITASQAKIVRSATNVIVEKMGQLYLVTPWRMLRMGYLTKGFEMYHNMGCYFISALSEYKLSREEATQFMTIKVLLSFSQKRKVEIWSSILRYIYLNSLGTHTDLLALIPDMVMRDGDSLIYLLQRLFCQALPKIYRCAQNSTLYDIFWSTSVDNFDLAAERFEESLFMAKSPFNPVAEHLKNLKSVLDTHHYFMENVGSSDPIEILDATNVSVGDDYFENLEKCDFNFDAKTSFIVGDYCGKYISTTYSKNDLTEEFNNIMNQTYTTIATGKGMRDTKGEFWGSKGFDVVYKQPLLDVPTVLSNFPDTPKEFSKLLSDGERSFFKKISELKSHDLVFDMKDKEQYKGSREIYVMSEETKLLQSPIEKFFGKLCRAMPNELIHKPSTSRPKFIHSKIFEHKYEEKEVMYCTMDCRKWAPRSNLWKYYFFVKGMAKYLPESFTEFFMSFWARMFKKTIRVQAKFVDLLKLNEGYKHMVEKYFVKSEGDYYTLTMPYSFMMGIFNYLSSLMHAASQLYFSEKVAEKMGATCNFIAHSDDSGGIIVAESYQKCVKIYSMYEKFQRSLNHLMSRKKCCLSVRSFEMISIMYNDQRFIPMVHKFITNVSFEPSGSGWYSDISNVVSKIVDLYNNGGSLLQCYLMMLTLSELYRKAYHLPRNELLSHVPLSLGGVINMHPIHLIMVGSSSHECLLDLVQSSEDRSKRISFYISLCGDYSIGIGSKLSYRMPYYKRHSDTVELESAERMKLEAISSLPQRTTILDYLKHVNRLFQPKYVYSLTGVDTKQLVLSTLFYNTEVLGMTGVSFKLRDVLSLYQASFMSDAVTYHHHDYPRSGYHSYFKQVENMKYDFTKIDIQSTKSCKPVRYSTIENFGLRLSQENLMILSAIEKWSGIKGVLQHSEKYDAMKEFCLRALPGRLEDKISYLKNFDPSEKEERVRSGYLFIPSNVRIDNVSRFFAYSMIYTSRRYHISRQKPQLFTPSDLNNFSDDNSDLQHLSICYKVLQRKDCTEEQQNRLLKSLETCPTCKNKEESILDLKLLLNMLNAKEFEDFYSTLPFLDYVTTQNRGSNVWFSTCDFDLVTKFGSVESRFREGIINTTWNVADANNLPRLWQYYTQACKSRGLSYSSFVYSDTGFKFPKLAFNSFESPYVPALYTKAMVLPDSIVIVGHINLKKVHRRGKGFYYMSRPVDLCIYAVYDVNQLFFDSHSLNHIRSLLYDLEFDIPKEEILKNFTSSKLYNLILNDDRHLSVQKNKYERNGFLGQPGSLTRALVLSDEKGQTRYRSSYKPQYFTKGVIEFDTVEGVPVVDMFEKLSMARLTTSERSSFGKAMEGLTLNSTDRQNLIRVKNKMGLESLGSSITIYKHIMRGMMANSTHLLPVETTLDILKLMLDVIHSCMAEYPREQIDNQYWGKPKSFWSCFKSIITNGLDLGMVPELLSQGLLRSKLDNQDKFWQTIREDPLMSCLLINNRYYGNIVLFIRGMLAKKEVGSRFYQLLFDGDTPKYRHLALAKNYYRPIEGETDSVVDIHLKEGPAYILNEDALDMLTSGESIEEYMEEFSDGEDEVTEREWTEDKLRYTVFCNEDLRKAMQETALNEFSTITILSPCKYVCFPWLGKGDYSKKNVRGMDFFVSVFPGEMDYPTPPEKSVQKVETREFRELAKAMTLDDPKVKGKYIPKTIKDRDEAKRVMKDMGIFIPEVYNALYPDNRSNSDWISDMLREFDKMGGLEGQLESIRKRESFRYHLPGFQGVVDDSRLKAEVESIFGPNGHYLFTGSIKLTESSYKQFMRSVKRIYGHTNSEGRAKLMFIVSTMLDTVPSSSSDSWYTDIIAEIIEDLEAAIEDEEDVLMMPVPANDMGLLSYREKDPFE
jgi:hypothetical protein